MENQWVFFLPSKFVFFSLECYTNNSAKSENDLEGQIMIKIISDSTCDLS